MRKILMTAILMLILIVGVEAESNRLYFYEKDGKVYYDTDEYDKNGFMAYDEMQPGKVYTDKLEIKNDSKNTYDLYLRVNSIDQELLADELVDNLMMEIYIEGSLVYEGEARALAYDENGVQYQEMIKLGTYKPEEVKELTVKTRISEEYTNTKNEAMGELEWEFFAGYKNGIQPIIAEPNGEIQLKVVFLSIFAIIFSLVFLFVYKKHYGLDKKMRMKKVSEV